MRTFGTRASFWVAGTVVALSLWASAAPTMTYPLYESTWHVSAATATWIFAVYPIVLVPVLVLLGDVSDRIGRRAAMLSGLAALLAGSLLFALAPGVVWVFVGRAFMGLGVGLALSPASVAMVEFAAPGKQQQAGAMTTAVSAVGIALAMTVGGALTQYAPWPLHLSFYVLAAAVAAALVAAWFLPRHTRAQDRGPWRIRTIGVPRGSRAVFAAGAVAFASAFLIGAVVLPLGAQIAHQLAGSTNALITGLLLSVFAGSIALGATVFRGLGVRTVVLTGALLSIAGVWFFVLSGVAHSLVVFFFASALCGIGYSLDFMGGLRVFSHYSEPRHRAGLVSGGYLAGYLAQGVAAPSLGAIVTAHGLDVGLRTGATAFSVFFVAAAALTAVLRKARPYTGAVREEQRQAAPPARPRDGQSCTAAATDS